MRRLIVLGLVALAARAETANPMLTPQVVLAAIDTTPTQDQINAAIMTADGSGADPAAELVLLAQSSTSVEVRLRAIHALPQYCKTRCAALDPAHDALTTIATAMPVPDSGSDLLILRAAIESIGLMRVAEDESAIVGFLYHPSRDVRATTARALGDLCNTSANLTLRTALQSETVDQVKLAISAALRELSSCTPLP